MSIWTDEEGRIHVGIMVGGKRIHRRMPEGATKGDAKSLEAELRSAIGKKAPGIPGDPMMTDVMGLYMAHADTLRSPKTAKFHALRTGPWMIGKRASEVQQAVSKMISDMRGHYQPATINRSIGAIKTALSIAYLQGVVREDHGDKIRRLPENNARHSYLTIEQVKKLADCASEQVRAAIWIALLTGCRRGEILKMKHEDIGEKSLRIHAGNTKTLRERTVPVVPALRPWLEYIPLQINFEGLKTGFRRAREAAGLQEFNFHDLRHSCASLLINMNTPLEVIRDILGHTTVKTTERYSHLQVEKKENALLKLSGAISVQSGANQRKSVKGKRLNHAG